MTLELRSCTFGYHPWGPPVLDGLDFTLSPGLTMLLGPGGAGKTTLLRLAAAVSRPRRGTVTFQGIPSHRRAYRAAVAWVPRRVTAMAGLTAREQVAYTGWLKGMSRSDAWHGAAPALARVDLADRADTKVRHLSGGQVRRVYLASALVHGARLLLLDEPTADLDSRQCRVFREVLSTLTWEVPVLLATHAVAGLAGVSDQVAVLEGGALTFTGSTRDFLAHAPAGTAPGRAAEAAYAELSEPGAHL
ncbi:MULTISPECIES: ATP-binding cassette domain-containing protein [unclassified Streptomyces]|uniref:ATP-binding cassette domain-containing protein n=1 Tax=unclassified Streptomyces TaxID=2593676 RepID=UPI002DDA915D|nr:MULTISPECIES: ATP-binding cassette domain-containing protein [unclassified Streptomyces]WSA90977.1 ATP-binding cassette domain-containing protein [Streptomyces sp. NBC_01795]WSS16415.1 ATP-binding cassette domain-containing protein [Streptomyces sp. NBC_01186]WSS45233.1 ATP-binding cassette domain-containing protein [Streptomyces sp. NBC_01187]